MRDLLSRMTLEEKAAQMVCMWRTRPDALLDGAGDFDAAKAKRFFRGGKSIGQVARPSDAGKGKDPRRMAELANAVQKFFVENGRLGIPVLFHEECLHGHWAIDASNFPQPIALAGTFNPALVERLFAAAAAEVRARGAHQALAPVVDVARDPRWGRCEETFGEDPYLVSRMGVAAVRGLQGDPSLPDRFRDPGRVLATLKHFTGHGQPESGMNAGPANVSERVLREVFFPPVKAAVQEAGAASVMASYNEVDGVPAHASRRLLRDVLRKEWGFEGFVISDYWALNELGFKPETHGHYVAADKDEAALLAVRAGVNLEAPDPDIYTNLVRLVKKGRLKESQLDELVAPLLFRKFELGLFENPFADPDRAEAITGSEAHRALALESARESITLLKNEGGLAPLDLSRIGTLAVIGPNADRVLLGGYSGVPRRCVPVLQGIRERVGDRAEVLYAEGCKITVGGSWNEDAVVPSDPAEDRRRIAEALEVARGADAIVLVLGGNEQTSREAWSRKHMGDRASLDLIGRQEELARELLALGKPVIVFLFNGRPLSVNFLERNAPAIFECWYLGQEAGRAVAGVLFGDFNPGGKLPITVPRSVGHLPAFYNHKPSARRGYLFDDASPLFAFGYGLSYTTFSIGNIRLGKKRIRRDECTRVFAEVSNTGPRAGSEVVQMYVRDMVSSVTRPVKELKGFTKVFLQPGETRTVSFDITPENLSFHDIDMRYVVEPGEFAILIGNSSRDEDLRKITLMVV